MARYIGPTCKLARREGVDLGLKSPRARIQVQTESGTWAAWCFKAPAPVGLCFTVA
jgi:hypothetical protein